jgi:hypothetical protein
MNDEKMSLEELISLERIENFNKKRLKETYLVFNLNLSKLFVEVLDELKRDNLPVLDICILLYSLKSVPFIDEAEGIRLFETLKKRFGEELFGMSAQWKCRELCEKLEKISTLITYEYFIEGSLIVYQDYEIEWDLSVHISPRP